jgi:hypothetical protein
MNRSIGVVVSVTALLLLIVVSNRTTTSSHSIAPNSQPARRSLNPVIKQEPVGREISQSALQQIQALEVEKNSRTVPQRKIDSQLLYAVRMRRGESVAAGLEEFVVEVGSDSAGLVTVDVTAVIDQQLLKTLRQMGVEVLSAFPQYHTLRAVSPLDQLEAIASLSQVRWIQPRQEALFSQAPTWSLSDNVTNSSDFRSRAASIEGQIQQVIAPPLLPLSQLGIGIATSQGDTTHRAFSARGTFNTDGTGIRIGVLSDGVNNLVISQSTGDLGTVTVMPGQAGSGDEGTAMLEIIHDLAPGAQLFFATANGGIANFALGASM